MTYPQLARRYTQERREAEMRAALLLVLEEALADAAKLDIVIEWLQKKLNA